MSCEGIVRDYIFMKWYTKSIFAMEDSASTRSTQTPVASGDGEMLEVETTPEENADTQSNTQAPTAVTANTPVTTSVEDIISDATPTASTTWKRLLPFTIPPFQKKYSVVLLFLCAFVIACVLYVGRENHTPVKEFTHVYSFVPEKISKSAMIPIHVPNGVSEESAKAGITFSPNILGSWIEEEQDNIIIYAPKDPMRSAVYYAINMDTGAVQMSGDFYVDEDPQIEAIFPALDSETHEDSEITIVFNRPMVPLTTLTEQAQKELPIIISPETPGTWKWVSTRNLQFIPETTLIPSSQYTVKVGDGLVSVDGLSVASFTHTFITRPLRYDFVSSGNVGFRSPIIIQFNQAVDIDKTAGKIKVVRNDNGTETDVSVKIVYGDVSYYDRETKKNVTEPDPTKLFIYQSEDVHGRNNLWDFKQSYTVVVEGAVPLVGTLPMDEERREMVYVPDIVENVSATSERSSLVRPDLFDPEGTLRVTFYEDIDKDKSRIEGKGLKNIAYGERCKKGADGEDVLVGTHCEKEPDTKTLLLTFDSNAFTQAESFTIGLKSIYTQDGLRISEETIEIPVTTYPSLAILRTSPNAGEQKAPLNGMYVCTNAPLRDPGEQGIASYVHTEAYIVYGNWSSSEFISDDYYGTPLCGRGEFQTFIQYGVLPKTGYTMTLSLTDEFGGTVSQTLIFTTKEPEEQYTRFHNLQQQYQVTSPDKTKLTYAVENLEYVDMHICRISPEEFLRVVTKDVYDRYTPPTSNCLDVVTERIPLPVRYWVNNYFQIDLAKYFTDTRGHYVVTFSNPLYTSGDEYGGTERQQLYDRTYVSVTNIAVGKKEVKYSDDAWSESTNVDKNRIRTSVLASKNNLYWVNDNKTLEPLVGATVTQYTEMSGPSLILAQKGYGVTDGQGIAKTAIEKNVAGAVIRYGSDTAVIARWSDELNYAQDARDASRTYVYTDRPIYRPKDTVHIRGIDRIGFDGSYEVWKQKDGVSVQVYDSLGEVVYETRLTQSAYGTFATDVELKPDAPLGTYRIEVFGQSSYFDVEEYVPSAFELSADVNQDEYINGDMLKLTVQAKYYFGVPLETGTVSYTVTAQDYYFDRYTDEYFNFGSDWYYCYSCGYGDDFLFRGETKLNRDGVATIERALNFKDYFEKVDEEGSKLITVSITARDINGRSVSMQKSFIVHKSDFYIGAKTDTYYTSINTPIPLRVKTVDTKGVSQSIDDIEKTVYKVTWDTFKRQEVDGGFYYRSEKRLTEVGRERINTDGGGNWNGEVRLMEEGEYEIHLSKAGPHDSVVQAISSVYIFGSGAVPVPQNNNYELDIEVQKPNVEVGEKASLLIKSPYDHGKVLITIERGTLYEYAVITLTGGLYFYEFPIKSEYAPNVFVSALLLSKDPEVKFGSVEYTVGKKEHELSVNVTPNKTNYLPGEQVTLHVETKDSFGRAVPAEVSLAVVDLSVLALKGNPKKNPLLFFYDGFPLSVTTASNIKNILHEVDIPLGTKGGGGANPDDLSKKKRGIFKDTAYWEASVETNGGGTADVIFTLPDNLTTWQVESLGVTKDTQLGTDYDEFTTRKDLMAVPLKPRFVVPGDTFSLGAQVFNQTDHDTTVTVDLKSPSLTFVGDTQTTVPIQKGESKTVFVEVRAPEDKRGGEHTFTFTATDGTFTDSVEQSIPITENNTYETVATAYATDKDTATEYLYVPKEVVSGKGGLTIHANATMAVFMTDALTYMATYPYGCSEQLASALSTIGTLTKALTLPHVTGTFETIEHEGVTYTVDTVVKDGLQQLYQAQTLDGGFAYYKGLPADLPLTLHVATALIKLNRAGYTVEGDVLNRAMTYIENTTQGFYAMSPSTMKETVILAEYVLRLWNGDMETSLTGIVEGLIDDTVFLNEQISSMTLSYLTILTAHNFGNHRRDAVYTTLTNRIDIDGRGAYLKPAQYNSEYFETRIKDTALLLKVFSVRKDKHATIPNVLRWLLASRDAQGVWGGTHNTFTVIDAMIDYLTWQHETESNFTLKGLLGGTEIFTTDFTPKNIFSTFTHFTPIDALTRETLLPVAFERTNHTNLQNNFYYDMTLKYYLPVYALPPRDEGITVERGLFALDDTREKTPLQRVQVGDVVRGKITLSIPADYAHISVKDFIPAGFEIVNFNLSTEDQTLQDMNNDGSNFKDEYYNEMGRGGTLNVFARALDRVESLFQNTQLAQLFRSRGFGGSYREEVNRLWPTHTESHDDRVQLYIEHLSPGVYEYEYYLRALVPGTFQHLPARAEELFFPEIFGRTSGDTITITPSE